MTYQIPGRFQPPDTSHPLLSHEMQHKKSLVADNTFGSGSFACTALAASKTLPNPTIATPPNMKAAFLRRVNCLPSSALSIIGVSIFIIKIEYKQPSGRFALMRIKTVMIAAPKAKIVLPCALVGEVTGSVSINTAPKTTPPVNT